MIGVLPYVIRCRKCDEKRRRELVPRRIYTYIVQKAFFSFLTRDNLGLISGTFIPKKKNFEGFLKKHLRLVGKDGKLNTVATQNWRDLITITILYIEKTILEILRTLAMLLKIKFPILLEILLYEQQVLLLHLKSTLLKAN